jgi:hypothetical protein
MEHAFSLNRLRWTHRPLLLFAPGPEDRSYRDQTSAFGGLEAELEERDMLVIHVFSDYGEVTAQGEKLTEEDTTALRTRYEVTAGAFALRLVGKDGGVKLRSKEPVAPWRLFSLIDSMPMRRREMGG